MLRWNGEHWSSYELPACCNGFSWVQMSSPTDGWAGGDTLAHWNGHVWSTVSSTFPLITSAAALLPDDDGWAVGGTYSGAQSILRYDPVWSVDAAYLPVVAPVGPRQ